MVTINLSLTQGVQKIATNCSGLRMTGGAEVWLKYMLFSMSRLAAGIHKEGDCYLLRHSCATYMLENGHGGSGFTISFVTITRRMKNW